MGRCTSCGGSTTVIEAAPSGSDSCTECPTCQTSSSSCNCRSTSPCQEDHTTTIIKKKYAYSLRTKNSFNWPSSGDSAVFSVENVERLAPGTMIYNEAAGYLHVTGFDCASQQVTVENRGEVCNIYTGGEMLPPCTDFSVGPPPCNTGNTPIPGIPYLAADFTAPGEGNCQLASVTTIEGLTLNDIISINGYRYQINDIPDSETIELCDLGEGAPLGTVIYWDSDGDEIPNIPVIVISSENPCEREPVNAGVLLVCDELVSKPLAGTVSGQVPVWNSITGRYELKTIDAPLTSCTPLTADLTVDTGDVGPYVITVLDTSAFTTSNIIQIDGIFYTVTSVDDATTMHITAVIEPTGIETYPSGTAVCLDTNSGTNNISSVDSAVATGNISSGQTKVTTPITLTITNPSTVRPMSVMVNLDGRIAFNLISTGAFQTIFIETNVNSAGYSTVFTAARYTGNDSAGDLDTGPYFFQSTNSSVHTVLPGETLTIDAKISITYGFGGGQIDVDSLQLLGRLLGVVV